MNKKGLTSDDVLEWIKIGMALILGYIIIKALLKLSAEQDEIKCVCDCLNNSIKTIYLN